MSDRFLIIDEAGVIECASAAAAEMFGFAGLELNGQTLRSLFEIPAQPAVITPPFTWLSASPHPILQGIHRDGRRFPVRLTQNEIHGAERTHFVLLLGDPAEPGAADSFLQHKELYELATRQGRIGVWEVDYRTNNFEVAPVLAEMLGIAPAQLPAKVEDWQHCFEPDDWQIILRESGRMLRREITEMNLEARMVQADGGTLWVLVRGKASFDEEGRPIRALGTTIDIHERKMAEQRAHVEHAVAQVLAAAPNLVDASTLILKAICEALRWHSGAIWCVDADARVLHCVQTWHQPGIDAAEFEAVTREARLAPGVGLPGRVWPTGLPTWAPDVAKDANFPRAIAAAKAGLHGALAFPILLEKTVLGVIEFFSRDVKPPDEDLLHMMAAIGSQVGQFIERRKAEEERDLFFKLSLDLLCIADVNGFRRVNPAFCKALGYSAAELTSRPFLDFVHPEDVPATRQAVAGLQQGKDVILFENRYRCKDGSYRWLSWQCPAPTPGTGLLHAVARDVTEAKRVQEELENARRDAEQANRAKSDFLSRMSHELRTPLNAILGFGQLLQREPLTDKQRDEIGLIVKGGQHLLVLINEVLDISRIEVGRLDLSPESVALPALLHEVVNLTQPMAAHRGIVVVIDEPSVHGRMVLADQQRLKQVLLNLVTNAIKYNHELGRVRIHCEAAPQGRLCIHVADTGPGLAADKQARLFTPFDRLGAETTPIEGSGLGLVLSKRLVEVMGGKLHFLSKVGQGTRFTIELTQSKAGPTPGEPPASAPALPSAQTGAARTVLYIEDNAANTQLLQAVLAQRPSIRLITAAQGGLGIELAHRHHPDLILLDLHLPDMKGPEVMARFNADPLLGNVPVVIISADATAHQIERLLAIGAREYLTKPIDVDQFLRVVDRYLL